MEGKKILIVDDEATSRTMLGTELERIGYQVFLAEDGDSGYQIAKAVRPDLIISDILMPQMDGNQLMKKLRESVFGKNIPFVVLSARGQMKGYFEMMNVDGFIEKPVAVENLLAKIEQVLKKYEKTEIQEEVIVKEDGPKIAIKRKILILDNEDPDSEEFQKALVDNKFEVDVVRSLSGCLNRAVTFKPDLVAIRFMIDRTNGDKLVKTLKELPNIQDVPFIVYSRMIRGWEEKKVVDAGAECFVGEVSGEKLVEVVKKIFN